MAVPDLESLGELHQATRSALDSEIARLMERRTALRAQVEECEASIQRAETDRASLDRAEELYRDWLSSYESQTKGASSAEAVQAVRKNKPPKARVGPQRYHMLNTLRELGRMSADHVAEITGLQARRVRHQLGSDLDKGVVASVAEGYELTGQGADLLNRFEASRRARGVALPTLEEALAESEGGHPVEDETSTENEVEADEDGYPSEAEAPHGNADGASEHNPPQSSFQARAAA